MFYYYFSFTIFAILIYAMIVDENVSTAIILITKIIKLNLERFYWMIVLHPKNPITNIKRNWEYNKIAKDLYSELNDKNVEKNN